MPYVPTIRDYKPFYIQAASDATAWDTRAYGLVAQSQPFPEVYEVKAPYGNDWHDEHGDDEYVAAMHFKSFEHTIKFYIKAYPASGKSAIRVLNEQRDAFRAKLVPGEFKIWDSWQERGYVKVRFVKESVDTRHISDDEAWMIFSLTFKVNDPQDRVTFANNVITVQE